jgi:amino acid permease
MTAEIDHHSNEEEERTEISVQGVHELSVNGCITTIIKCAIGAGSFSLPRAFAYGGVYLSIFFTIFLGMLSAYTLVLLIDSSEIAAAIIKHKTFNADKISMKDDFSYAPLIDESTATTPSFPEVDTEQRGGNISSKSNTDVTKSLTYPDVGAIAFPEAEFVFRRKKYNLSYYVMSVGILMTSLGVSAAYVCFISETLPQILRGISKNNKSVITEFNTPLFIMPIVLFLSFLRTMKVLTYTSLIGNIAVFFGCVGVITYGYMYNRDEFTFDHNFVEYKTLSRYVGGNTFLFAIHLVALPLMEKMGRDSSEGKRKAIRGSFLFITLFNTIFGTVGFLFYASSECKTIYKSYYGPCDNILLNMKGGWLLDMVKVLICIDLLFTIPLILAAAIVIIEKITFESNCIHNLHMKWMNYYAKFYNSKANIPTSSKINDFNGTAVKQVITLNNDNLQNIKMETSNTLEEKKHFDYVHNNDCELQEKEMFSSLDHVDRSISDVTSNQALNVENRIKNNEFIVIDDYFTTFIQYLIRSNLVIIVIMIAISVPQFGDMINLVGGEFERNLLFFCFDYFINLCIFLLIFFLIFLFFHSLFFGLIVHLFICRLSFICLFIGLVLPFTCFILPPAMHIRLNSQIYQIISSQNLVNIHDDIALIYKKKRPESYISITCHIGIIIFGCLTMLFTVVLLF